MTPVSSLRPRTLTASNRHAERICSSWVARAVPPALHIEVLRRCEKKAAPPPLTRRCHIASHHDLPSCGALVATLALGIQATTRWRWPSCLCKHQSITPVQSSITSLVAHVSSDAASESEPSVSDFEMDGEHADSTPGVFASCGDGFDR